MQSFLLSYPGRSLPITPKHQVQLTDFVKIIEERLHVDYITPKHPHVHVGMRGMWFGTTIMATCRFGK